MDYERGLKLLRERARETDWEQDVLVYQALLLENLNRERLYGTSATSRAERATIISALNQLSFKHLDISFSDILTNKPIPH